MSSTPKQAEAKKSLEEVAKMEEYGGSIYAQARVDKSSIIGPVLSSAISRNSQRSFHSLECSSWVKVVRRIARFSKIL